MNNRRDMFWYNCNCNERAFTSIDNIPICLKCLIKKANSSKPFSKERNIVVKEMKRLGFEIKQSQYYKH